MVRGATLFAPPLRPSGKRYEAPKMRFGMTGQTWMLAIRGFEAAAIALRPDKMEKDMMEAVHEKMLKIAGKILARSQQTCPVGETLKLVSSGRIEDLTTTIAGKQTINIHVVYGGGTMGVEYAVYVHEGHVAPDGSWVRGRPWLVRAAKSYRRELYQASKKALSDCWGKYCKQLRGYKGYDAISKRGVTRRIVEPSGVGVHRGGL